MRIRIILLLLIFILISVSCGPYSFSGKALKGIDTVAVPLFENQTTRYGIREELTEEITDAIIEDNTLKVVNIRNADSALRGVITEYRHECYTFDGSGNCNEYICRIFVNLVFEDLEKKESIWEEVNLEGYGIYSATNDTEEDGIQSAIDKLSRDILDKLVKGW